MLDLTTPVRFVKRVGDRVAEGLAKRGVETVEDLLYHLPFRYEDRLNPRPIAELTAGTTASLIGYPRTVQMFTDAGPKFPKPCCVLRIAELQTAKTPRGR